MLSKFIYKDILSPSFLMGFPWLISLCLLPFTDFAYDTNSFYFLYLVLGIIVFNFGYYASCSGRVIDRKTDVENLKIKVNNTLILLVIIVEIFVVSYELVTSFNSIASNLQYNFYFTLKNSETTTGLFISYFRSFNIAFTLFVIISYFRAENLKRKKVILLIQIILGSLNVLLSLGRTSIFLIGLASLSIYIIYTCMNNKKIFKALIVFGMVGIAFFSIYNIAKYPYLLENNSLLDVLKDTLLVYTSSSVVTFQKWASLGIDYSFGENTFRFINAVLSAIGYEIDVNQLVNQFMDISNDYTSNVYTFYYYYAMDFGMVYALIIQFFVGMIHGFLYKKMTYKRPFWVYLFSLSLYPLFMQFFQDQYFSLTSTWIQYMIYGLLLFKSGLFMKASVSQEHLDYNIKGRFDDNIFTLTNGGCK